MGGVRRDNGDMHVASGKLWAVVVVCLTWASARADDAVAFRSACAAKAAAGDSLAVSGIDGWSFLRAELRHLGVGPFWGTDAARVSRAKADKADPLPAIVDFARQLRERGIALVLVPVPCKAAVYPDKLGIEASGRVDRAGDEFAAAVAAEGVTVLDLGEAFLAARADTAAGPLYCRTDTHWSPRGCEVAAAAVADRLTAIEGAAEWLPGGPGRFTARSEERPVRGDLVAATAAEVLPARVVSAAGGGPIEGRDSPVLLLGDSHVLVYHAGAELHGTNAGLADQLALELGLPIDVIGVRGSGATPARINLLRRAKAEPAYLPAKKVVVWCFAAREFTEGSGWAIVPLPAAGK